VGTGTAAVGWTHGAGTEESPCYRRCAGCWQQAGLVSCAARRTERYRCCPSSSGTAAVAHPVGEPVAGGGVGKERQQQAWDRLQHAQGQIVSL
jgi:hypothetical protein